MPNWISSFFTSHYNKTIDERCCSRSIAIVMNPPSDSALTRRDALRRGAVLATLAIPGLASITAAAAERNPKPGDLAAMAKGSPVIHFEIGCRDLEKARSFYSQLFDWHIADPPMPVGPAMIAPGKGTPAIDGHITALGHEPHRYVTFYVQVDDIDAALKKAESLGGKKVVGPVALPVGTFAWFNDPEGNMIGLWTPK